ncbi:MAG: helix-hairpin-helix domain-containing protein [Bacteroidia bacterium]|nr:helix-hairpin-helix domain-containing protein [Bacteroidia bacterium]
MEKLRRNNHALLFCLIILPVVSFAQTEDDFERDVETWVNKEENAIDFQDLYEQTTQFQNKKLNLNKATYEDLSRFSFLSSSQIFAILNHRMRFGDLLSIYELQVIEELDEPTIIKMIPYVMVSDNPYVFFNSKPRLERSFRHELVLLYAERLERAGGYFASNDSSNTPFAGSPQRIVMRYKGEYNQKIRFGFVSEKDAGEDFFTGSNPQGFDFNSVYITYKNDRGIVRNIVLGDFQATFGQGLTFGSGLFFGKSSQITNIKCNQNGFRPNRSLNENDFLRGGGITIGYGTVELSSFIARNRMDGTLSDSDTSESFIFSSFASTGLHRTQTEITKKNSVGRTMLGGNLNWKLQRLSVGYTSVFVAYDYPFVPQNVLYNQFRFSGGSNFNQGVNYSYLASNWVLFGEVSSSAFLQGISYLQGGLLSLGKKLDFAFLHRDIAKDYTFVYSSAFTESSTISNEKGTYMGFVWRPSYKWTVNLYHDIFAHEWLKYRVDAPSDGSDFMSEIQFSERKKFIVYARFQLRHKSINTSVFGSNLNVLAHTRKCQVRFNAQYFLSPELTLKARAEWVQFEKQLNIGAPEHGSLAYIDITKQFSKIKTRISCRYSMFNTDSYDSRIYTFESDVMYSYSIPAYQHSGSMVYLLIKSRLYKGIDLWIRYSRTIYSNINTIGSGVDKIEGNKLTDLKIQLSVKF